MTRPRSRLVLLAVLLSLPVAGYARHDQSPLAEAAARAKAARSAPDQTAPAPATAPAPKAPKRLPVIRAPRGAPFLWRIEGPVPTYLFGTIHVPDAEVLALPPSVESAFAASAVVYTEIPMDAATQFAALGRSMLPDDRRLKDVIGKPLFDRLSRAVDRSLPDEARATMGPAITAMLDGLKPWAAMSQLSSIEFLPDMMAGRQPLDAMLYTRAQKEGKTVGALETVDEQVSVFEAFTDEEQTRMLQLTLDELDAAAKAGRPSTQEMITGYLSGDLERLGRMMTESMQSDKALSRKFVDLALDRRNVAMTDRIVARRAEQPDRVCFFAVGAGHYAGDGGIIARLVKKGLKVTRLSVQ
jgi:uncharacterized protein YbaP (TraB family)